MKLLFYRLSVGLLISVLAFPSSSVGSPAVAVGNSDSPFAAQAMALPTTQSPNVAHVLVSNLKLQELHPPEIRQLIFNQSLRRFIRAVKAYPANASLMEHLEHLIETLLQMPQTASVVIHRLEFPSPVSSPWEENNTVYAYRYEPVHLPHNAPAVVIPSYVGFAPVSRAAALLLADRGFRVLEINMPLYGDRAVIGETIPRTSGARYAALELTPEGFLLFIRQAVGDVLLGAEWLAGQPGTDPKRIAVFGHSLPAAVGLLAFSSAPLLTHAMAWVPVIDWARTRWEVPEYGIYRQFLEEHGFTREHFAQVTQAIQLNHLPLLAGKNGQSQIAYVTGDPYNTPEEIGETANRLRMQPPKAIDPGNLNPHAEGYWPLFGELLEATIALINAAPAPQTEDPTPHKQFGLSQAG